MTRPIIVTGASGFIGRMVAARLVASGEKVVSFGRGAPKQSGVEHLAGDLGNPVEAMVLVDRFRPCAILALASAPPPAPEGLHDAVTLGSALTLMAAARRVEGCRFIAIGSAAEYGAAASSTAIGEYATREPLSAYGRAKARLMDAIAERALAGEDVLGLRLFAAIGPDMPEHSLLGTVVRQLREPDRRIVETGRLDGERDYLPVAEVATLTTSLALAPSRLPPWINVGAGQGTKLRDLVAATIRLSGRDLECREVGAPIGRGGQRIVADTALLRSLGYEIIPPNIEQLAALALGNGAANRDPA